MRKILSNNKFSHRTGAIIILVLSLLSAGCGGSTLYNLKNTTYDEAWQASIKVRDKYNPMDTEVKRYGVDAFKTRSDKEKGVISFATNEVLITHLENTVKLKDLGNNTVQVSVKSIERVIFLPWLDRNKANENRILSEIRTALGGKVESSFEIRLVSKSTPTSEGIIPEGDVVFTSLDISDAVADYATDGKPTVIIILNDAAKKKLSTITAKNTGEDLFIIGDGEVLAMHKIDRPISNGVLRINNNFSSKEARELMDAIWLSAFGTTSEN